MIADKSYDQPQWFTGKFCMIKQLPSMALVSLKFTDLKWQVLLQHVVSAVPLANLGSRAEVNNG